jgi:polyisoprenoid-binding protein YceI
MDSRLRGALVVVAAAVLGAAALAGPQAVQAADTYSFDKGHSKVLFFWNHVGLSNQSGRFDDFDGTLVFDQQKPENSRVEVTIQTGSIDTDVPALDKDLLSENFFNASTHPQITFVSTKVHQSGTKTGRVTGDLTINGVTKPVTLDVTFNFAGEHPLSPYLEKYKGAQYTGFSARARVLRSEFGMGRFAPLTSDEIDIVIETEMRKVE